LRKLISGGVIAVLSLAVAAVALAQNPAPTANLKIAVTPKKVGTKANPRSGRLELTAKTNREAKATASKIEIWIAKGARLSTKGLPACSNGKLNAQGAASCPAGSKAGSGEARALLNPYATTPAPILFVVTAFAGGKLNAADAAANQFPSSMVGKEVINFHLKSESPAVDQALAGVITTVRGSRTYGQKLTINIAENLQQPATGVYSSLQSLETSIGLKRGSNMLMKLIDCPSSRELQFQLQLTFVPNPTPPAKSKVKSTDAAACSG
jgi:hypothetical protein